jgi:hypothetical protein
MKYGQARHYFGSLLRLHLQARLDRAYMTEKVSVQGRKSRRQVALSEMVRRLRVWGEEAGRLGGRMRQWA